MPFDNRKEFAGHETIAQELEANIYFAHPDHSWERGLNENSKRLLRRYFPKNMKFTDATEEQVSGQSIVSIIDHAKYLDLEPRMKYSSRYGWVISFSLQKLYFEFESTYWKVSIEK